MGCHFKTGLRFVNICGVFGTGSLELLRISIPNLQPSNIRGDTSLFMYTLCSSSINNTKMHLYNYYEVFYGVFELQNICMQMTDYMHETNKSKCTTNHSQFIARIEN